MKETLLPYVALNALVTIVIFFTIIGLVIKNNNNGVVKFTDSMVIFGILFIIGFILTLFGLCYCII